MTMFSVGFPGDPPRDKRCVYWQCGRDGVLLAWVVTGDADHMDASWNSLCGQHCQLVIDRWVQELKGGGACKSLLVVLP